MISFYIKYIALQAQKLIKCPSGDACLYLGEMGEREDLLAPAYSIAYSSATIGRILFKFSTCIECLLNFHQVDKQDHPPKYSVIIISPDESRGYIGFRSVAPPPPPPPP